MIEIDNSTGTTDIRGAVREIEFYPNPAKDKIYISPDAPGSASYLVKITDLSGKLQMEDQLSAGNLSLNVGQLERGVYLLTIRLENAEELTRKLVVR